MRNCSWTAGASTEHDCDMTSEIDTSPSTTLPPRDAKTVTLNDVYRFVYNWFTLFEHRVPAAQLAAHLPGGEPFHLVYPGAELRDVQQFTEWYEQLLANTTWNFHRLAPLTVELAGDGNYHIDVEINWHGGLTEDSTWDANRPDRRFHFVVRQQWQVKVHAGSALDDPFHIVGLVTEMR